MQRHVGHTKLQLSQHAGSSAVGACLANLLKQFVGQYFARLVMNRHAQQRRPMVTPILHELAGKFDGIPFNAADPRNITQINGRHHMLQSMAKLMKQRLDLAECHQRWRLAHGRRTVANQMCNR